MKTRLLWLIAATLLPLSALAIALPISPVKAQNNIVLFGAGKDATLGYKVRNKRPGARSNTFSFFAKLPNKAIAEIQIVYPEGFRGIFNASNVVMLNRRSQKKYEVREVIIDREVGSARFIFQEPITPLPGQELEILTEDVTNPNNTGMYRIQAQALGTEASPLFQYLGQWLVSIY
jgi:hypothetical protein